MCSRLVPRTHLAVQALLVCAAATSALGAQAAEVQRFDLPSQGLRAALQAYSTATGIEVNLGPDVNGNVQAAAVRGEYTPSQALEMLLKGTGLIATRQGERRVQLVTDGGQRVLSAVRIQGTDAGSGGDGTSAAAAPNGSSDRLATEGTQSLTTNEASIATKIPLALKDTPQSVSVITRQRLDDQQLDSLEDALRQAPGVAVVRGANASGGDNVNPTFYSRGFEIRDFQIDGGVPLTKGNQQYASSFVPNFDLSLYDRVELLRGAGGVLNGVGDPGGVLSLERKRPTDRQQLSVEGQLGSNQKRRVSIDGSTPLLDAGRLAVRGVFTHDDSDFFYDAAHSRRTIGYINLEAKPVSGTQFNVGGSVNHQNTVPWSGGLPRATDGSDLQLPRSFCLCTPDGDYKIEGKEVFAQWRQALPAEWKLQLNFTRLTQSIFQRQVGFQSFTGIDRETGLGLSAVGLQARYKTKQNGIDVTANGEFELFGRRHQLNVGANLQRIDGKPGGDASQTGDYGFDGPGPNIFAFDPSAYPLSAATFFPSPSTVLDLSQRQWGVYANSRLQLTSTVHLLLGWRAAGYQTEQRTVFRFDTTEFEQLKQFNDRSNLPVSAGLTWAFTPEMTAYVSRAGIYQSQGDKVTSDGTPLRPVTGTNAEIGIKRADFGGTLNSSLAYYDIRQKNAAAIDQAASLESPLGQSCCYLIGDNEERSRGFDIETSGALSSRWQLAASYNWKIRAFKAGSTSTATSVEGQTFLPKNTLKLWSTYQLSGNHWLNRLQLGAGLRVLSATRFSNSSSGTTTPVAYQQGGYAITDLMLRYRIDRGVELQLNVDNVFDRSYYETLGPPSGGSWYGAPRSALLTLKWSI